MDNTTSIRVDLSRQSLELLEDGVVSASYPVSTARNGAGQAQGSECTPLGRHVIRAMIGAGEPSGAVFVGRRPTGEICDAAAFRAEPSRDWILSRILWLSGTEVGRNRSGTVDSMRRYIYIHGTPDEVPLGVPLSHGCIRMRNAQLIELFSKVCSGTIVDISDGAAA
jgi:lipoprotein-anchoring transpeptidase ErfK/SrfK